MTEEYEQRRGPNFRPVSPPDGPRASLAFHIVRDADGTPRWVSPADRMTFGEFATGDEHDTHHPIVVIYHRDSPNALSYIMTVEEMEAVGGAMLEMAAKHRAAASDQLSAVLRKRGGQGA